MFMGDNFSIFLSDGALKQYNSLDLPIKERLKKRVKQLETLPDSRSLKAHPDIFAMEAGQYRILYIVDAKEKKKTVVFIGDHKKYEKFYYRL